jgi:fructokinase
MNKSAEVCCVGELIVVFISTGVDMDLVHSPGFLKRAGGAAANVAVGCAKLGVSSRFIGRVGNDAFGRFLRDELSDAGVDVTGVRFDPERLTRLAFVSLSRSGEREFEFHETKPADETLRTTDLNLNAITRSRIVHFSSFLLLREPARSTVFQAADALHRKGTMISFDPNIRIALWKSRVQARQVLAKFAGLTTILRLNEQESEFLTGRRSIERSADALLALGPALVVITRGAGGCYLRTQHTSVYCSGFRTKAVDTTGCGDGFLAGLLAGIVRHTGAIADVSTGILTEIGAYANAVGALTATRYGVISALPFAIDVQRLITKREKR